jgi:hypothetical protein
VKFDCGLPSSHDPDARHRRPLSRLRRRAGDGTGRRSAAAPPAAGDHCGEAPSSTARRFSPRGLPVRVLRLRIHPIDLGYLSGPQGADARQAVERLDERARSESRSHEEFSPNSNTSSYNVGMSKVMVSLPDELVRDIDEEARRRSMSRSALLAAAARRELARRDPVAVAEAIARSEHRFRAAGGFDAAQLVRQDRNTRR